MYKSGGDFFPKMKKPSDNLYGLTADIGFAQNPKGIGGRVKINKCIIIQKVWLL